MSVQVLALVKERYWGVPWYWPKIVVVDGGFFCNIALEEGKDYLISGRPERYGVVDVSGCSRTQPFDSAQVDLRTLDGSLCASPGGTVIGRAVRGDRWAWYVKGIPDVPLTLRDQLGKAYRTSTDADGIYQFRHLARGVYRLDSQTVQGEFIPSGTVEIAEGECIEGSVNLQKYDLWGRAEPGMERYATVRLIDVAARQENLRGFLGADGKFYFTDVPDGEYLLALDLTIHGAEKNFYYPGTENRDKATKVRVVDRQLAKPSELAFDPKTFPVVPVPVTLDPPIDSRRFDWRIRLTTQNNIDTEERWVSGQAFATPYGVRNWTYKVQAYGYSKHPDEYGDCWSEIVPVTASSGLTPTHILLPENCR